MFNDAPPLSGNNAKAKPAKRSRLQAPRLACTAALGLGANLGDREAALQQVVTRLARFVTVSRVSSIWESAPVGPIPDQPTFLNAVCLVSPPSLETHDVGTPDFAKRLLILAQQLETQLGRQRTIVQGPREIDVDVLLVGHMVSADPQLALPHPRMYDRAFVLAPLAEVLPLATLDGVSLAVVAEQLRQKQPCSRYADATLQLPQR